MVTRGSDVRDQMYNEKRIAGTYQMPSSGSTNALSKQTSAIPLTPVPQHHHQPTDYDHTALGTKARHPPVT